MIVYRQGSNIYQTLFRVHGSALYRGVIPAFTSTAVLLVLDCYSVDPNSEIDERWFTNPYPISAMIAMFTFLLTFKTSFSYNRYWEACTAIHQMHSKWLDIGIELASWHLQSKRFEAIRPPSFGNHPEMDSIVRKRERLNTMTPQKLRTILDEDDDNDDDDDDLNYSSMYLDHASVANESKKVRAKASFISRLGFRRRKKHINTIIVSNPDNDNDNTTRTYRNSRKYDKSINSSLRSKRRFKAPSGFKQVEESNIKSISDGQDDRPHTPLSNTSRPSMSRLVSVAKLDGGMKMAMSPNTKAQHAEEMVPSLFLQEASHLLSLLSAVAFTTLRNDLQKAPSPLAEYTVGSPWPSVDPDDNKDENNVHLSYEMSIVYKTIYYLLGLTRSSEQRTVYNACRPFRVLGGVSDAEIDLLQHARGPLAKTALVTMWLQEFMSREFEAGALGKTPAPSVSRLFQFCSDGMVGYNQARKVAYVPFPFPHTQLTTFYVVVLIFFLPVLVLSFVRNMVAAAVLNTLTAGVFVGLFHVSNELEDPFRNVPNDLPLNFFQAEFNEALVVMFAGFHPEAWWDIGDNLDAIVPLDIEKVRENLDENLASVKAN
jgi:predicted membrane chloride channel (bestrophin family)